MSNKEVLTYREIREEEIPHSAEIIMHAYNALADQIDFRKDENTEAIQSRLREFREQQKKNGNCRLYGGFLNGQQIGFFVLQQVFIDEEAWEICMFCIEPEEQNRGYGSRLLLDAIQKIKDLKGVLAVCMVFDGNPKVKEWLGRYGFLEESTTLLEGGHAGVSLMRKDIRNPIACDDSSCNSCADCT